MQTTTDPAAAETIQSELRRLACEIEDWRELEFKWSKADLLKWHPGLGSERTFNRIISGDLADVDCSAFLSDYRAEHAAMLKKLEGETTDEPIDTLSNLAQLRLQYQRVGREKSNRRVVLIFANQGVGKSTALRYLVTRFGTSRIVLVEASAAWAPRGEAKGTSRPLLEKILIGLGVNKWPSSGRALLDKVIEKIGERRVTIAIDEAHHLTSDALDTLKTLINLTKCEIILAAMPTLWDVMESTSRLQIRQLTGPRLFCRLVFELQEADIAKFLEARLPQIAGKTSKMDAAKGDKSAAATVPLAQHLASLVKSDASRFGNMMFCDAMVARLRATPSREITAETFAAALAEEIKLH